MVPVPRLTTEAVFCCLSDLRFLDTPTKPSLTELSSWEQDWYSRETPGDVEEAEGEGVNARDDSKFGCSGNEQLLGCLLKSVGKGTGSMKSGWIGGRGEAMEGGSVPGRGVDD